MALAARPRIDFNNRLQALRFVGEDLGLPANQIPAQGMANSGRSYLKFVNFCRTALALPVYLSLDYGSFTSALNIIAAAAGATKAEIVNNPFISSNATPPVVGSVITSTTGIWLNASGATYAYAWKRSGTAIGANQATYTIVSADLGGKTITCDVTATTAAGASTPATSNTILVP